jgi:iron complex outermembrane receptor protein
LGAQYELLLANGGSITPRLDYSYNAGYFTNASNDANSYLNGYHVLNGRVTYRTDGGKWEFAVVGSNLTDKLWYTQMFDLSATQGQVYGLPSAPRTVWVEAKKKF